MIKEAGEVAPQHFNGLTQMEALRGKTGKDMSNGPAKLCQAMAIDKSLNGWDVAKGRCLWLEPHRQIAADLVKAGPRIGIDYADPEDRDAPLRFWLGK